MHLCRFSDSQGGARLGLVRDGALYDISGRWPTLSVFLGLSCGRGDLVADLASALAGAAPVEQLGGAGGPTLVKPTDDQEVWAAGVTY